MTIIVPETLEKDPYYHLCKDLRITDNDSISPEVVDVLLKWFGIKDLPEFNHGKFEMLETLLKTRNTSLWWRLGSEGEYMVKLNPLKVVPDGSSIASDSYNTLAIGSEMDSSVNVLLCLVHEEIEK